MSHVVSSRSFCCGHTQLSDVALSQTPQVQRSIQLVRVFLKFREILGVWTFSFLVSVACIYSAKLFSFPCLFLAVAEFEFSFSFISSCKTCLNPKD